MIACCSAAATGLRRLGRNALREILASTRRFRRTTIGKSNKDRQSPLHRVTERPGRRDTWATATEVYYFPKAYS
jgi:hypothetical protein